jgi:hypothetical protein
MEGGKQRRTDASLNSAEEFSLRTYFQGCFFREAVDQPAVLLKPGKNFFVGEAEVESAPLSWFFFRDSAIFYTDTE